MQYYGHGTTEEETRGGETIVKRGDKFKCEHCRGEFNTANSSKEAQKECNKLFGKDDNRDEALICDDCFNKLVPAHARRKLS